VAIHASFPDSPYTILDPDYRRFPADEALRESSYEKLLPPLVHKIRSDVKTWRESARPHARTAKLAPKRPAGRKARKLLKIRSQDIIIV
jgi:type III restriction enzyme